MAASNVKRVVLTANLTEGLSLRPAEQGRDLLHPSGSAAPRVPRVGIAHGDSEEAGISLCSWAW